VVNGLGRIGAVVTAGAVALGLAACGSSSSSSSTSAAAGSGSSSSSTTASTSSGSGFKVGLVTDIGGLNDHGFNHLSYVGLQRAVKQFHIGFKVDQSASSADYIPNLSSLAQQGYDLVICVGFLQEASCGQMAAKFPNTHFAGVDMNAVADFPSITKNFEGIVFHEEQAGYEAGYLAGLEAKRLHGKAVSSVGGIAVPAVIRYIAGYQAGARAADPGVTTLNGYSQDFVAQDKCKNVALDQISKGSIAVFAVAGGCGLGALDAAKEKNVWGIGVDQDQSFVNNKVLTSAYKKVDLSVYTAIARLLKGHFFGGGNLVFSARSGGVGLGKINAAVPKAEVTATLAIAKKIANGTIKAPVVCSPNPNC
jgi:basic membrane protein A and related proteins